jgi:1,4-alpha-glucan branching enzyme
MNKKIVKMRRVQFEYRNDEASSVFIVGDFNAWNRKKHEMVRSNGGTYLKTLMLPHGSYQYKFLVDGKWKNDPLNKATSVNCFRQLNNVIYAH